jgi:hypothetical protein
LFSLDEETTSRSDSNKKPAPDFNSFDEALDCHALGKATITINDAAQMMRILFKVIGDLLLSYTLISAWEK